MRRESAARPPVADILPRVNSPISCPRCHYDLRAITQARCPECGLEFAWDAWRQGLIRDEVPSTIDRCDPWRPHALLAAAAVEMVRCALTPRRALARIALDGPPWGATLILIAGAAWVHVLVTAILAVATALHANVSPYAAILSATLRTAPPIVLCSLLAGVCSFVIAASPSTTRVARLTLRPGARLMAHWVLGSAAYAAVPTALGSLLGPGTGLETLGVLGPLFPAVLVVTSAPGSVHARVSAGRIQLILASLGVWLLGLPALLRTLAPASLTPPLWIMPP